MSNNSTNLNLILPDAGEFVDTWGTPLNSNFNVLDALFGSSGHTHSGANGDGGVIDHASLSNIGTLTHTDIDAHIADSAIHQDTQVNLVQDDAAAVNVLNVNTLRFANSVVSEVSPGIALVTPDTSDEVDFTRQAPVVAYESFGGDAGTELRQLGWDVNVAAPGDPVYVLGSGLERPGGGSSLTVQGARSGFFTATLKNSVPHSQVQRVGVLVNSYGSVAPQTSGGFGLWLHLLSGIREGATATQTAPIEQGLSFYIKTKLEGGVQVLTPGFAVKTSVGSLIQYNLPIPAPAGYTPVTGTDWDNLPIEYINGTHEFSISVDSRLSPTDFTLRYYYNGGLVFMRKFASTDTVTAEFYGGVMALLEDLKQVTLPASPDYGSFGFSTTYDAVAGVDYTFNITSFFASSIEELDTPRFIDAPDVAEPGVNVCGGAAPWTGIQVGDSFDPDGGGPLAGNWIITGVVPATGAYSEGFTIVSPLGVTETVYCLPPEIEDDPEDEITSLALTETFVEGVNLFPPLSAEYKFFAGSGGIPITWDSGYDGNFFNVGDELPDLFCRIVDTELNPDNGRSQYTWDVQGGIRLPWGETIDVQVIPKYSAPGYEVTYPKALKVRAATPTPPQVGVFVWDEPGWRQLDSTSTVTEGQTLFVSVSGTNLPLGPNFWSQLSDFAGLYGLADTTGTFGSALRLFNDKGTPFEVLWDRIESGNLNYTATPILDGPPPAGVVATASDPGVGYAKNSSVREHVLGIIRLSPSSWEDGSGGSYFLEMQDTESPQTFPDVLLFNELTVQPKPPTVDVVNTDISSIDPGATTVDISVNHPDTDMTVTFGDAFGGAAQGPFGRDDVANVSIVGDEFNEIWTVSGLVIDGAPGEDLEVTVTNVAAEASDPGNHTFDYLLGVVSTPPVLTPTGTYVSGTVDDSETEVDITINVDLATLEPGVQVTMDSANPDVGFQVGTIDKSAPITGTDQNWVVPVSSSLAAGATAPTDVTLRVTNPNAATFLDLTVPYSSTAGPAIQVGAAFVGTPTSGNTEWDTTAGLGRTIFIRLDNTTFARVKSLVVSSETAGVDINIQTLNPRSDISGGTWYQMNADVAAPINGSFGLTVTDVDGDTHELVPAITLISGVTFGDPTGSLLYAYEGQYASFSIPGSFVGLASNVEFDLLETASGPSLVDPSNPGVVISSLLPGLIEGSCRVALGTNTKDVYYKLTYIDTGEESIVFSGSKVTQPAAPVVDTFVIAPNTENTTGATVTVTGTALAPIAPPAGQAALTYGYTITETGGPVLVNTLSTGVSESELTFTTDINASTAGETLGMTINYLTDTAIFTNLATIAPSSGGVGGTGGPGVGTMGLTGPNGGDDVTAPAAEVVTQLTVTGVNLDNSTVSGIGFEVVGYDNAATGNNLKESPPASGAGAQYARELFTGFTIVQQSGTTLVANGSFPKELTDTNLRMVLLRPAGHVLGEGVWGADDIDNVSGSDVNRHTGLMILGPAAESELRVNPNPNEGQTRLDSANEFQSLLKISNLGLEIDFTFRTTIALTAPPVVYAEADTSYGAAVKYITVSSAGSSFEWRVTCTLPTIDDLTGYPLPNISSTVPVYLGLKLSNGRPLVSGLIGVTVSPVPPQEEATGPYIF